MDNTGSNYYDPSELDIAGGWDFPGSDVSAGAGPKPPIRIQPLKQGFVVEPDFFDCEGDELAFTDAVDAAEWLLAWLGFDDYQMVESIVDILKGLSVCIVSAAHQDNHERRHRSYERAIGVAEAAQGYIETGFERDFIKLEEAVKKWRGIEGRCR